MNKYLIIFIIFFLCSCLMTRRDIEEKLYDANPEDRIDTVSVKNKISQKKDISVSGKFFKIDTTFRELRGKIEVINKNSSDNIIKLETKLTDIIKTLTIDITNLKQEIQNIKTQNKLKNKTQSPAELFYKSEALFTDKKWKSAIIHYAEYRKNNKKGKFYKQATFKIGTSFKNLGMHKESKVFLTEVWESFPKSLEGKKAKKLLTLLKKK